MALSIVKLNEFGISSSRSYDVNRLAGWGAHSCRVPSSFLSCVNTGSTFYEAQHAQA